MYELQSFEWRKMEWINWILDQSLVHVLLYVYILLLFTFMRCQSEATSRIKKTFMSFLCTLIGIFFVGLFQFVYRFNAKEGGKMKKKLMNKIVSFRAYHIHSHFWPTYNSIERKDRTKSFEMVFVYFLVDYKYVMRLRWGVS